MEPLTKEETGAVGDKTKALMLHRIGDMARLQTDAIIISSCLGVVWVGLIGNKIFSELPANVGEIKDDG